MFDMAQVLYILQHVKMGRNKSKVLCKVYKYFRLVWADQSQDKRQARLPMCIERLHASDGIN